MCGIFGIFGHPKAAELTFFGLHALQHRGQESAGISVSDGESIQTRRGQGLVSEVFFKEEDFEQAKFHLITANDMLPSYTGYPSPALVLSQIFDREGNQQEQFKWLEVLLENLQHDYDSAVLLAEEALENQDFERADYYIDRAIQVDPYRSGVHELKARYANQVGDADLAVTEYEVLLKLDINDPVEARTDLAQAYLNNGQLEEAKQSVLFALEIAPSYRRAQEVLLKSLNGSENQ